MKAILVSSVVLMLSACATTETQLSEQSPRHGYFQIGRTTYSQVVDLLGEPNHSTRHPDGSRSSIYFRSQSRVKAESVTFFGTFQTGTEVVSDTLSMTFDKTGTLLQYSVVSGQTLMGAPSTLVQSQASR